jgi:formylglycine-generating enzyme required for sulfatase activity
VGSVPSGDGRYGQSDLAGGVYEWNLDNHREEYPSACNDCAQSFVARPRVVRGGATLGFAEDMQAAWRGSAHEDIRSLTMGARCARAP